VGANGQGCRAAAELGWGQARAHSEPCSRRTRVIVGRENCGPRGLSREPRNAGGSDHALIWATSSGCVFNSRDKGTNSAARCRSAACSGRSARFCCPLLETGGLIASRMCDPIYGCATQNYGPYSSQTACFTAGRQIVNAQQISCRARHVFDDRLFDDPW
jgi:hypothetical protein